MGSNDITISELKRSLTNELTSIFSPGEAQSHSKLILEHLGFSGISILREPSTVIDSKIQAEIKKIVDELRTNKPIQYILGETEFHGLLIKVDKNVLIPRQETEELVSIIIKNNNHNNPKILDVGTGSACIAIALARNIKGAELIAMDVDPGAISIAKKNARNNKVDIEFLTESLFDFKTIPGEKKLDILVSNPPYVTESEREQMAPNVTEFEPGIALFVANNDPLIFYREIIRIAKNILNDDGSIWLEINEALGKETKDLFLRNGYNSVALLKDIHEKDRFIKAER